MTLAACFAAYWGASPSVPRVSCAPLPLLFVGKGNRTLYGRTQQCAYLILPHPGRLLRHGQSGNTAFVKCSLNFMHQDHLKSLIKHRFLGPIPRKSDSGDVSRVRGVGKNLCF